MEHTYTVIMAGGSGTRLWPLSRKKHPKHLLPLFGRRTLFQSTVDRLEGLVPAERILVVTAADQEAELRKQAPQLPAGNFLVEPEPHGTAAVVGLAAAVLHKRDPEAAMIILPSDHFIRNVDLFQLVIRVAVRVARQGYLVTLEITPTFPATGFGYIQRSDPLPEKFDYPVYRVLRFTEKPDETHARQMLAGGDHTWNSGMFIWCASRILDEIARQMPVLHSALETIGAAWGTPRQKSILESGWQTLKVETIDYGVMEHAERVAVLPAGGLDWSDVGSWDSLFDVLVPDSDGNIVVNSHAMPLDTHNTLIYGSNKKLIVTIGLDDLIIVDTEDAVLICHKEQAQQVRQVIANLKSSDRKHLL